jgi:two-component system, NarL family, nitrate/nitrite response regulator NarL
MPSIVCVVVHPSRIVREGLTSMLARSPFEPACTASSTEDVPSTIAGPGEQVLVLIGVRKGSDLAEALSAAKAGFPHAHLVVFGDSGKRDLVTAALELGATSFVDENIATSALVKELELVALGEPVISVYILKQLLGSAVEVPQPANTQEEAQQKPPLCAVEVPQPANTQGQAEQKPRLSNREAAILNALIEGASNKLIAYQLKITEATVKVHVKGILRKIRVKNRTQAAIWALNRQAPAQLDVAVGGSLLT